MHWLDFNWYLWLTTGKITFGLQPTSNSPGASARLPSMNPSSPQTEAQSLARRIVHGIVLDLCERRGTRVGWEAIDEDLRASMIRRWEEIAAKEINAAVEGPS